MGMNDKARCIAEVLEIAAPEQASTAPVRARVYFTAEDDGLALPWRGIPRGVLPEVKEKWWRSFFGSCAALRKSRILQRPPPTAPHLADQPASRDRIPPRSHLARRRT